MTTIRDLVSRGYTSDRIGLELELESEKAQPLGWVDKQSMWTVHNDGSLRQNGVEYVFNNPLWGGDIDAALQAFEDNTKGVKFIDTGYGSTHVHYNVGNLYTTEVMSIVVGWSILEDAFLTVCKPSRDGNNFAQRFNVLNQLVNVLSTQYTSGGNRIERLFTGISPDYWKYANLNLATIRGLGTLEFRPYHSTWDIKEIRSWIDRIVSFCKGMVAIGDPVQVLEEADRNLEAFISKYAGVPATEKLIDLTRRNISTAFRLAYVVDKWEDVKTLRASPWKKSQKKGYKDIVMDDSARTIELETIRPGDTFTPNPAWSNPLNAPPRAPMHRSAEEIQAQIARERVVLQAFTRAATGTGGLGGATGTRTGGVSLAQTLNEASQAIPAEPQRPARPQRRPVVDEMPAFRPGSEDPDDTSNF